MEVKAQDSNGIYDIISSLRTVKAQLTVQSRYLFSNFGWQGAVIAVGGVGAYWAWWSFPKPDDDAEEDSEYVPTPTSGDGGPTQDTTIDPIPFMLGTTDSDREISKIQKTIGYMMDARRWKQYDHHTEQQGTGPDIDYYWQCIRQSYGGDQEGDGGAGAEDGDDGAGV